MSVASIVFVSVKLLCTIFSPLSRCLASSDFVPTLDQHRELLNHPQFIRSGRPVNCVVVSERPISSATATPCINYCN